MLFPSLLTLLHQFLYAAGAIHLQINNLSFLHYERSLSGNQVNSLALLTYCALFTWFIVEYLLLEVVHLYTYDLFAEKIGFKLVWGCLFFYPFFYTLNGYFLATSAHALDAAVDISPSVSAFVSILFLRFVRIQLLHGSKIFAKSRTIYSTFCIDFGAITPPLHEYLSVTNPLQWMGHHQRSEYAEVFFQA